MPTNRRRIARIRRPSWLTDDEVLELVAGHNFFGEPSFPTSKSRIEAWRRHGATIMATWNEPGRRPVAYWEAIDGWPEGAVGEQHAVYLMPDTGPTERAAIEAAWLERLRFVLAGARDFEAARAMAPAQHGIPGPFFNQYAPKLYERLLAERADFRARCDPRQR